MNIIRYISIIFMGSLATVQSQQAKQFPEDIGKWVIVEAPSPDDEPAVEAFYEKAVFAETSWGVRAMEGKIKILPNPSYETAKEPLPFDTTLRFQNGDFPADEMLKVDDGWIAAYNQGEFGGFLYWFNEDGSLRKEISDHQINQFLIDGERILAVEGLAHMGGHSGSLIEIKKQPDGWTAVEILPLPGSGDAIVKVGENDYVIATSRMLIRVNARKEVMVLQPDIYLNRIGFNSLAIEGDFIYFGMRQFIGRCKLGTTVQPVELLLPDKSWLTPR